MTVAHPSVIPYAPAVASSRDTHITQSTSLDHEIHIGLLKRRRHVLIQYGDDACAIQEFKKLCLRNTVLALSQAERQRLKTLRTAPFHDMTQTMPMYRSPSLASPSTVSKQALARPLKPPQLCRHTCLLPDFDSLRDRMVKISREYSLTDVSSDVVALMALALHFHMKHVLMVCLSRLRGYPCEPPGETSDSCGYGMMRPSSALICHSFVPGEITEENELSEPSLLEWPPPITLKDLKMSFELHPRFLCEEPYMFENIQLLATSETEFDQLSKQMNEKFAHLSHIEPDGSTSSK